jgi:hypothetical protein
MNNEPSPAARRLFFVVLLTAVLVGAYLAG